MESPASWRGNLRNKEREMSQARKLTNLMLIIVLVALLAPVPAQGQSPPWPEEPLLAKEKQPNPATAPEPEHLVSAAEANITGNGNLFTWTQDTRADWETGTWEDLDGVTVSGTLQLAQRWFGASTTVTPQDQLAGDQWSPAIAVGPDGALYAVWADTRNGDGNIYFAKSTDGGTTWSANVRLNDDPGTAWQYDPAIAADAGAVYVAWEDERNGNRDIYFAKSTDGGATWSANTRLNDDPGTADQYSPAIAADADAVYVAWTDERNGNGDIYFAKSTDGGATWSANTRLNDDPGGAEQRSPALTADAGAVYVAWTDERNGGSDIYFARSTDGGATWNADVRLNDDPGSAWQWSSPAIAADAGAVYAAWEDERNGNRDIYFARSTDGGATWSADARLNDDPGTASQYDPSIAADADAVYAAWADYRNGNSDIYFARSTDGGATWSANTRLNDDTGSALSWQPAIAADADAVYAAWADERNGNRDIYFARSTDGGATWNANTRLDDDPGTAGQQNPAIAADADAVYATWEDERNGNRDIYFARSTDGGATWSANVQVNDDPGTAGQYDPALAADADAVYVVWTDWRNGNGDIYFAKSTDGGATWSANVRLNDDPGSAWQWSPAIAADANAVYAAWEDERNGNRDIYFARSTDGGATWSANVQVNDDTGTASYWSSPIIAAADAVYVAWTDERNGNGDIYFAQSTDGGATWSADVRVDDDTGTAWQQDPAIAAAANAVYAAWTDRRDGNRDIYFARSTDGGATWSANTRLNDDPGTVWLLDPAIAADADAVYVVWEGWHNNDSDIYFARSTDGGATWSANVRLNDGPGSAWQYDPSLAVDGSGALYAAWEDNRYAGHIRVARLLPTPEYYTQGLYTSPILDTGVNGALWHSLTYSATLPPGTSLAFETRSRVAGGPWSAWEPVHSSISSPPGQYFQYRVTFLTSFTNATPLLDWVKVTYHSSGTPSPPRFATPCGLTNRLTPSLTGSAAAGSTIHLYVDGAETLTTTASADGDFALSPTLIAGSHVLTATAENADGIGPASAPLSLTISPTLPYDPIGVRAGQWSKDGWLLAPPRDAHGCANPTNNWRVWPRPNQKLRVEVPVSYTVSAAVTVTVGTQTLTLTEEAAGMFVGVFYPPIQGGNFVIAINADGNSTTVTGGPVLIDPDGVVYDASGTISDTIPGVQVTLYYSDTHTGQWLMWDAWNYDQVNPQVTLADGYYSFYTPPGVYRVVAEKERYPAYTSPNLEVVDRPVRHNVPLAGWPWDIYLPLVMRNR